MIALSIIIPVFNKEKYLRACLDSIIAIQRNDFEVILVDDGSTDSSSFICDEYANDNRVHIIHKNNEGVSKARNIGIDAATGAWISFVDADDMIKPNYVSSICQMMDNSDLVYFGNDCITNDMSFASHVLTMSYYKGTNQIQEAVLRLKSNSENYDYYGFTWNKFFKSSIIKSYNIRFVDNLTYKEDEIFVDDYIIHCCVVTFLPYSLYTYRILQEGLTGSKKSEECYKLYTTKAESNLKNIINKDLLVYQTNFIYNIWCMLVHNNNTPELRDSLLEYVNKYHSNINIDLKRNGRKKWLIWNSPFRIIQQFLLKFL